MNNKKVSSNYFFKMILCLVSFYSGSSFAGLITTEQVGNDGVITISDSISWVVSSGSNGTSTSNYGIVFEGHDSVSESDALSFLTGDVVLSINSQHSLANGNGYVSLLGAGFTGNNKNDVSHDDSFVYFQFSSSFAINAGDVVTLSAGSLVFTGQGNEVVTSQKNFIGDIFLVSNFPSEGTKVGQSVSVGTKVPEPSTLAILALGLGGLVVRRKSK